MMKPTLESRISHACVSDPDRLRVSDLEVEHFAIFRTHRTPTGNRRQSSGSRLIASV